MGAVLIGIDCDGVLADYITAIRGAADAQGTPVADPQHPRSFSMVNPGWFRDRPSWWRAHTRVMGDLVRMPLLDPTAPRALADLRDAGHQIAVVTARRAPRGASYTDLDVMDQTERWLRRRRLRHDKLILAGTKHGLGLDVLLDDAPHIIEEHRAAGERVIVRDHAYNRHLGGERVTSMRSFADLILRGPVSPSVATPRSGTPRLPCAGTCTAGRD